MCGPRDSPEQLRRREELQTADPNSGKSRTQKDEHSATVIDP